MENQILEILQTVKEMKKDVELIRKEVIELKARKIKDKPVPTTTFIV